MSDMEALVEEYNRIVDWDMHWSNMHIVVEDGNMEDEHILWCMDQGVTESEKVVCNFLMSVPVAVRESIWEAATA